MGDAVRVLVTASRSFPALCFVRRFGGAGQEVFSADSRTHTVAEASRYVREHFLLPAPADDPEAYASIVAELARKHRIDLILPTCEEAFFLSQHRDILPESCRLYSDSMDKLEAFHNKFTFSLLPPEFDVRSPETHLVSSVDDLTPFREDPGPWVFKPVYSRFSAYTLISPTCEELEGVHPTPGNPWVAQERIFGTELSCYGIAQKGRLVAFSSYETPYRLGLGGGVYFVNRSHQTPGILDFVSRFVRRFRYTGQIGFDFMKDRDGVLWAMECNPRSTNGVWMFADHQPVHRFISDPNPGEEGVVLASFGLPRMVGIVMRLHCAREARRSGRFKEWRRAHRQGKDILFSRKDPKPYLSRFRGLRRFRELRMARKRGESVLGLASQDMDWSNPAFAENFESRESWLKGFRSLFNDSGG